MKRRHHCTSSHAKVTLAVLALCGMTAFCGSAVWASNAGQDATLAQNGIHYFSVNPADGNRNKNYKNDGAVGVDSLAVGAGAHADGRMGATALGNDAHAEGERALAVGNGSRATGLDAIAIGTGYQGEANGTNAIAIGEQSHAVGMYTTAVGSYSEATAKGAVALGQQAKSKGVYSTSIGFMANGMYAGGTANNKSTAVGAYSESSGLASVALGYNSKASATGSVALGMSSVADREAGLQGYHPVYSQMVDKSPAWQSSLGAVSVGAGPQDENGRPIPQQTRQIINLAAGTADTDAVNVAQLKEAMSVANKVKFATDDGNTAKPNDGGTVNIFGGDNIQTASSSTQNDNGVITDTIHINLKPDITVDSVQISRDGPKLDRTGLDMANQSITQLAPGELSETSTDAVNGSQLYATNQMVQENRQNITQLGNSLNKLDNRINRVGAGAAALAALHPLDFDPDDKWDFAAGYGNYRGANAAAVGLYYRPNEDTMFSVGGSFGGGENMINAGVSLKIGRGNHVSNSRVAMAKEIRDLRQALADQAAEIAQLKGMHHLAIDSNKSLLFPDVADNHWAYEYVSKLAGNGILEGYPDGLFKGNQMMTRYEFAAIVYRLMEKGLGHTDPEMNRLAREFSNELSYIRIDTIHQDKDGTPTVQRVRVKK